MLHVAKVARGCHNSHFHSQHSDLSLRSQALLESSTINSTRSLPCLITLVSLDLRDGQRLLREMGVTNRDVI